MSARIEAWIAACCERDPQSRATLDGLRTSFVLWCIDRQEPPPPRSVWLDELFRSGAVEKAADANEVYGLRVNR